jgi:hypothetical protein
VCKTGVFKFGKTGAEIIMPTHSKFIRIMALVLAACMVFGIIAALVLQWLPLILLLTGGGYLVYRFWFKKRL